MVGINTVLEDDPRLSIHKIQTHKENPLRVVVDSRGRTPLKARLLEEKGNTVIAVSLSADKRRVEKLKEKAEVIVCGSDKVNLNCLMKKLYKKGVKKLLLEGGGTLNWGMLQKGLVDEVRLAISPVIVGGAKSISLVEGKGYNLVSEGVVLELMKTYPLGRDFVMEYRVVRGS